MSMRPQLAIPTANPSLPGSADPKGMDRVFKALASQVRRTILDGLIDGPRTTTEITGMFPALTRFAVMQHLKVLVRARLVVVEKVGRERFNHLNVVPIQWLYERWVRQFEGRWAGMLTDLKRAAEHAAPTPLPTAPERTTVRE
jgi:DNA-binding transcriptional ArsR family regulator